MKLLLIVLFATVFFTCAPVDYPNDAGLDTRDDLIVDVNRKVVEEYYYPPQNSSEQSGNGELILPDRNPWFDLIIPEHPDIDPPPCIVCENNLQ